MSLFSRVKRLWELSNDQKPLWEKVKPYDWRLESLEEPRPIGMATVVPEEVPDQFPQETEEVTETEDDRAS